MVRREVNATVYLMKRAMFTGLAMLAMAGVPANANDYNKLPGNPDRRNYGVDGVAFCEEKIGTEL
jgi:hypothetical protein